MKSVLRSTLGVPLLLVAALALAAPADAQLKGAVVALVNDRYDIEFRELLTGHGLTARALDRIEGLDYSRGGGKLVLTLYRLEPG